MAHLNERVSYLNGLAEGLKISEDTNEGKLLLAILDILGEMADEIEMISDAQEELEEYIDEIDGCDDCDCDDCGDCSGSDDLDYFEITCEKCGNKIYLDADLIESQTEIECPVCKEKIEFEFDDCDCGDCDCDDCDCD